MYIVLFVKYGKSALWFPAFYFNEVTRGPEWTGFYGLALKLSAAITTLQPTALRDQLLTCLPWGRSWGEAKRGFQ